MSHQHADRDIIREIPLIQRYSRHNGAEDLRFRQFLKDRLDLPNVELDRIVQQTTDEVWAEVDCTTCAHCCRTLQIVLDAEDVRRLSARLHIGVSAFHRRYSRAHEGDETVIESTPCCFLGADNRCTVYEDRPKACRDFPYLHTPGFRSRSLTMVENCAVCPIVFNSWQRLKVRLGWRRKRA